MLHSITEAIRDGNIYDVAEMVQTSLDAGSPPDDVLDAMTDGLDECGKKFESGESFVPELVMAGDAFTSAMDVLEPHLAAGATGQEGTFVIGTVAGDVHDIGKNLVAFLLKSSGFKVINLGSDVNTEQFVQAVKDHQPDVLGLSALLTTTMLGMEAVIQALDQEGLRPRTKVIIGGAPVSGSFAESINADGYAFDAVAGLKRIKELASK